MQILRLIFFIFFLSLLNHANGQLVYYQNSFNGGVTAAGGNVGANGGQVLFDVYIEPGSTIEKAILIAGTEGKPNPIIVELNTINYTFSSLTAVTPDFPVISGNPSNIHLIDITADISPDEFNYSLSVPPQDFSSNNVFFQFYLVIIYNNPTLPVINFNLVLNQQPSSANTYYNLLDLNPINSNFPVGIAVTGQHFCDTINDGSYVFINSNAIGLLGGNEPNDPVQFCDGVRGHFYYQFNGLVGLSNDTPDAFMNGSDALANIQLYITQNSTDLEINFNYQSPNNTFDSKTNPIVCLPLAYSTPCQPQNVTVSNDTVVCPNVPLILHATGGTPNSHSTSGYEWLPQENLSCYDCADPIFTGDSSRLYTVRIWGSDSCSVVRPVMVRVRQKPNFSDLNLIANECGGTTGTITALSNSGVSYSLDSLSWQASPNEAYSFQNLSAGNYTIYVTDTSGCIGDSSVFLDETLTVNAAFSASPSSGAVPLEVSITNQSSNYSNLEWFINGVSQGNSLTDYTINQSSTAEITLIAWQNDPSCADTAQVSILAFDSLIISIPNVITANGDGVNDEFSVQSNLPISIEYTITNRWGNVLQSSALQTQSGPLILWNPATDISEGTYFYQLKFSSSDGNINQQLETWGRLKQGNVELVR